MTDRIEIRTGDSRRIVEVSGDRMSLGGGDAAIPVAEAGDFAVEVVRTKAGWRVHAAAPGKPVVVNGEELFAKDLVAGDEVALGAARLRWLPDAVGPRPAAAVPPRARTEARRPPRSRTSGPRAWLPVAVLVGSVVVAGLLLFRACSGSTWPRTPQHFVDLARSQFGNGMREEALRTLAFALREAEGPTREEALGLQREIEQQLAQAADLPALERAQRELDVLLVYGRPVLEAAEVTRPAARDLLRRLQLWQQRHGELCARHQAGRVLATTVEGLAARLRPAAALDSPDSPEDVLHAARGHLRFDPREYRAAVALLDAYLAAHPEAAEVRAGREALLRDGESWVQERLARITGLARRQRLQAAVEEFERLERAALLPQWEAAFAKARAEVRR